MADILTADSEMTRFSFPIEKKEDTKAINPVDGTPDIEIWGKASDGTLDSDLQVVDPEASLKWIKTWHDTGGNIRMSHDPHRPVGASLDVDGHYVKAIIGEPTAKHLIRIGALKDFSVGIMHPDIRIADPRFKHLDPDGRAVKGVITDRPDGLTGLGEISIVDRGANYGSRFQIAKAAADGSAEFTGKMLGGDDITAKTADPGLVKASGVDDDTLIKASLTFSPSDLAKLLKHRASAEEREAVAVKAAQPGADEEAGDNVTEEEQESDGDDADAGDTGKAAGPDVTAVAEPDAEKRNVSTAERHELAGHGDALPNESYPIANVEDLHNAAVLARSGHGDVSAARALIARRAKELGVANPLDSDDAGKAAEPDTAKAAKPGRLPCPKCKKPCKPGAKFCGKCGCAMKGDTADKAASPGDGVTAEHTAPVPEHREPDGTAMELLETGAGMADGDEASEMAAEAKTAPPAAEHAMTGKAAMDASLRHKHAGAPPADALLHDLLCPAYSPDDTARCFGDVAVSYAVTPESWLEVMLDKAASAPVPEAVKAKDLWEHAVLLKAAEPDEVAELRAENYAAFLTVNKSASDLHMSPATFPVPMEVPASRFRRPYVAPGHAASPAPDGKPHVTIPSGQHAASEFARGPLTAGHMEDSPGNPDTGSPGTMAPAVTGKPQRTYYRATQRERSREAMSVLHDHIAETHPDLCPMHGPGHDGVPPAGARPAPAAQGAPGARKDAEPETVKATARPTIKPAKAPCPKCGKKNKPSAQFCGGCGVRTRGPQKGATVTETAPAVAGPVVTPLAPALDTEAVAEAVKAAVAPLARQLEEQRRLIDEMGSAPDPRYAPFKAVALGGVLPKAAGAGEDGDSVAKAADGARGLVLAELQSQIRGSGDPNVREAAWRAYNKMLKLAGASAPAP